jgi:hypothetical protein
MEFFKLKQSRKLREEWIDNVNWVNLQHSANPLNPRINDKADRLYPFAFNQLLKSSILQGRGYANELKLRRAILFQRHCVNARAESLSGARVEMRLLRSVGSCPTFCSNKRDTIDRCPFSSQLVVTCIIASFCVAPILSSSPRKVFSSLAFNRR